MLSIDTFYELGSFILFAYVYIVGVQFKYIVHSTDAVFFGEISKSAKYYFIFPKRHWYLLEIDSWRFDYKLEDTTIVFIYYHKKNMQILYF